MSECMTMIYIYLLRWNININHIWIVLEKDNDFPGDFIFSHEDDVWRPEEYGGWASKAIPIQKWIDRQREKR